ncbi:hypothetical protein TB1_009254 [Malus domestica]
MKMKAGKSESSEPSRCPIRYGAGAYLGICLGQRSRDWFFSSSKGPKDCTPLTPSNWTRPGAAKGSTTCAPWIVQLCH